MKTDRHLHQRQPVRPDGVDYSHPGIYFVTLCTFRREQTLGAVVESGIECSPLGRMARKEWFRSAESHAEVQLFKTEFVVMPNHLHGIVWIVDDNGPLPDEIVRVKGQAASLAPPQRKTHRAPWVLGTLITGFKAAVAGSAGRELNSTPVWQPNYFYHVIKNQEELNDFRVYIHTNPQHWLEDQLHPSAPPNRFNRD
jgi:putative transposase